MCQLIDNQYKLQCQKTKIHHIWFLFRLAQQASMQLKISNVSSSTQKKTVHHVTMSPDKVFQEMNNYWSSGQSGSQSHHVFAKTLLCR